MVRHCVFPLCPNKMTSWTKFTFHRLPLKNPELLKLWLVVLKMDPNIPMEELRRVSHRVCSAHFAPEDFITKTTKIKGQEAQRQYLRRNAIPIVSEGKTDAAEGSASVECVLESELEALPQSTPIKSQHKADKEPTGLSGSHLASALTLVLTSPPQKTTTTKRSLSGKYFALAPTWSHAVDTIPSTSTHTSRTRNPSISTSPILESEAEDEFDHEVEDISMSFRDLSMDPADTSFKPSSSGSPSSTGTSSASASCNGETAKGWSERKWLVNESHLLQLFKTCPECKSVITERTIITRGSQIKIQWTCGKHSGDWQSCPDRRGLAENNLQICAATFFTGSTFTDIADWASLLNVSIPHKSQFYKVQKTYVIPTIQCAYQDKRDKIISRLVEESQSGKKHELCGDARCDSPGYSAKYSTYSFQDDATKEILHFELVQVTEATSSVAMEVMGFQRGLKELLDCGVDVAVMTTDRSPSIRKLLREEFPEIRHEFDPWHVVKGVKKKIVAASKRKDSKELLPWLKAITNHMYWSCESSKGDQELCIQRWTSVIHHISGVHRWEEDGVEYTCSHPPLSDEQQERKKWIDPASPAFKSLKDIVTDNNLLRDLKQMSLFKHTGSLEAYHSVVLKYAPKRIHFHYDSMRARTQLAIMDHNENVGRPQATTKEGQVRWSCTFSKQSHEWVIKPIYAQTTQNFRLNLMERVLRMRDDPSVVFTMPQREKSSKRKRLLQNIATVPRPEKSVLVARRTSRFGRSFRAAPY